MARSASPKDTPSHLDLSRRRFLQAGASVGALSLFPAKSAAAAPAEAEAALPIGLYFTREELPRIRESLAHPTFAAYWESCRNADLAADRKFLTTEIDLMNRVRHLAQAANMAYRSSFVYLLEGREDHRDLALLAIETVLKFNRWDWILEDGKHTVGVMRAPSVGGHMACAVDWLGDALGPALRQAVLDRLSDEVGPACYRAVRGELGAQPMPKWSMDTTSTGLIINDVSQWPKVLANTNLQIIATSGLILSASMLPDHPDRSEWIEMALRSMRTFIAHQPKDGSFGEGSAYWGYTYTYFSVCVELLRRFHDIDERGIADFPAMSRYFLRSTMPTKGNPKDCLTIGDCAHSGSIVPLVWIAREFRDSTARELLSRPGMAGSDATMLWGAIWFDPTVPAAKAADITKDYRMAPGLVVSRSGWGEQDAVLSLRSGRPENHEHADRNSLLFAAHGERLLGDPIKASYDPDHPRWLLRLTEAHSAVLIDGKGHTYHQGEEGTNASKAHAELVAHQVGLDWMTATSDATEAYALAGLPVLRVARTVVFLKPGTLVVYDSIDLSESRSVEARFQAYNDDGKGEAHAHVGGFRIQRPNAALAAQVETAGSATVTSARLDLPPDMGVYPFAAVKSDAALSHRVLTVCQAGATDESMPEFGPIDHNDGVWSVTVPTGKVIITENSESGSPDVVVQRIPT